MVGAFILGYGRREAAARRTLAKLRLPVPKKGYMLFAPDHEKANYGPEATAGIINGNYSTMPGQGMVGGPHIVTIVGTDGVPFDQSGGVKNPMRKPLFPEFQSSFDLPKQSGRFDFAVPDTKK